MKDIFQKEFFMKIRDVFSALSDKYQKSSIANKTPGKKVLIIGFVVIILALAAFSAIVLIDENTTVGDGNTTDMGQIDPAVLNGSNRKDVNASFLFALTDTEKTEVKSLLAVDFNSEAPAVSYSFISPFAQISINGTTADFSEHFAAGGTNQLMLALSEHTGTQFDRYIISDETSFYHLIQLLGETTVEIENRVSYEHNGVSFIIDEGTQLLTPDMMLKYYLYLVENQGENREKIVGIIIDILERLVSCEDDATLENNFCTALGYFDTNISALDFSNNKELIKAIPQMDLASKAQLKAEDSEQ